MSEELRRLWETGTPVRENIYSRTRRNSFSVNDGGIRDYDIQRIQIPFPSVMEKKLKARFRLRDDELGDFYQKFQREIANHVFITDALRDVRDPENIDSATLYYEMRDLEQLPGGYDIYFVTKPATALMNSRWLSDTGAMFSAILTIGSRLLQSVRAYSNAGFSLGTLDMDSMVMTEESGTTFIRNAFFFAASAVHGNQNNGGPSAPSALLQTHMPPKIRYGEAAPSFNSDIYAVCSILWSMLNGQHPSVAPTLTSPPRFCPEKLASLLAEAMTDGVSAYKELQRELRTQLNALADGSTSDFMITFDPPFYSSEFDALEKEEKERLVEAQKAAETPPEDNDKKKKLLSTLIIGIAALAAVILSYFFYIKPKLFPPPEPEPTPVVTPIPTPKPTPTPDPNAGRPDTTSAEVGLYTYGDLIVDKYGNPSSRFYVNADGDIECEPSRFPSRYSELEFSEIVLDLRESDLAADASGKTMQVKPEEIAKYGLDEGLLLLPPGWDMTKHLPRIGGVSFTPEEALVKTFLRYATTEEKDPTAARVEIDRSRLEGLDSEDVVKEFYTTLMAEALNATMTEDKAVKWKEQLDVSGLSIDIDLSGSEWYEEYQNCDEATHQKLLLLEREPETEKIKSRVSHANGADITLYYDDAGNTYTEDDWDEQEALRAAIEETKAELDSYKAVEGVTVLVPYWAVEEYVFVEGFEFGSDPLTVDLHESSNGKAVSDSFMATIRILPENATCKEVDAEFNRSSGLSVPYNFNSDYIAGEHATYERMTSMTLDFSKCSDGVMALAMEGSEFGRYKLKLVSKDGHAEAEMTVELQNNGVVPTPTPEPTPTPTSAPTPAATPAPSSGQPYTPAAPQTPITTPEPVVCTPEPTPVPTATPTPVPAPPDDDTLTVTPKELKMKVGETFDLKPSLSCSWSCSAPSVASIGGPQGRTVTAKSVGTCEITARSGDGQTFTVTVTVTK